MFPLQETTGWIDPRAVYGSIYTVDLGDKCYYKTLNSLKQVSFYTLSLSAIKIRDKTSELQQSKPASGLFLTSPSKRPQRCEILSANLHNLLSTDCFNINFEMYFIKSVELKVGLLTLTINALVDLYVLTIVFRYHRLYNRVFVLFVQDVIRPGRKAVKTSRSDFVSTKAPDQVKRNKLVIIGFIIINDS